MIFKKRRQNERPKVNAAHGLWKKCEKCGGIIYNKEWEESFRVCPECNYHYKLSSHERIQLLIDAETFEEQDRDMSPLDPLNFQYKDTTYKSKIAEAQKESSLKEGIVIGKGMIHGKPIELGVMDFDFLGGSMGSVVGEKINRAVGYAIKYKIPLVLVTTSGGARMQEGMISLMQMAKTSAALAKLERHNLPYIALLTHPTTGGVSASFAMLGDLNIAEPNALIGFAGPRVIEQTIKQKLPPGFQSSQFQLDHGFIDLICDRKKLKDTLYRVLDYLFDWK